MNYQERHAHIIQQLKSGQRALFKLTPELLIELRTEWQKALEQDPFDHVNLTQIFCVLDHTQNYTFEFNDLFQHTFQKISRHELVILALAASQKHIINESLRSGIVIPPFYFDQLKELLKTKNPEILEWTLRTIESMGPLSLRLKQNVRQVKPSFLKSFNTHQKKAFQIIELLESQWRKML